MLITSHKPRLSWIIGSGLAILTLAVYIQARNFDFILYDDPAYVTSNTMVTSGLSVKNIIRAFTTSEAHNWHPITWLSLMLDSRLFGINAGRFHLTNMLLHTASTVLLFVVLIKMTKAPWASAFAAGAFALHPLHIQSVAWVAERKDVLSALFWMLTLLFYLRYTVRPSIARYTIALFAFALGLMAKSMLVTLPIVLLLLDYWPLGRFRGSTSTYKGPVAKLLLEKVPFFVLAVISGTITFVVQQQSGAMRDIVNFPLTIRIANAFVSYIKYIERMFWPANLSIFYLHPGYKVQASEAIICALLLVAITVLVIRFARARGYLFVGWMWYVITLVPVIGLVQVGDQAMADRYTYIPLIGLFIIVAWGLPELLAKYAHRKTVIFVAATAAVAAMSISTYIQLGYWRNSVTIFEHAVEVNPKDLFAQVNYGSALLKANMFDEAITHLSKAVEIDPNEIMTHLNLGVAFFYKRRIDEAIVEFEKTLEMNPRDVFAHLNLGTALAEKGKTQEAIEQYTEALRIDPNCTDAYNLRQGLLQQQHKQ
jgi:tetratricopeptide (TPR) repeat protein